MGKRPTTELERMKARTWAIAVKKHTGCRHYTQAAKVEDSYIDTNLLQKISRGERSPKMHLYNFPAVKDVYIKGPLDIALWDSFLGITKDLKFGNPDVAYSFFKLHKNEYDPDKYIDAEEHQNSLLLLGKAISDIVNFLNCYEIWNNVYILWGPLEQTLNDTVDEAAYILNQFGIAPEDIWHVIRSLYGDKLQAVHNKIECEKEVTSILSNLEADLLEADLEDI